MASAHLELNEICLEKANLQKSIQEIETEIQQLAKESLKLQAEIDALVRKQIAARANVDLERLKFRRFSTSLSNTTDNRNIVDLGEMQRMMLDDDDFRRQFLDETDDFEAESQQARANFVSQAGARARGQYYKQQRR